MTLRFSLRRPIESTGLRVPAPINLVIDDGTQHGSHITLQWESFEAFRISFEQDYRLDYLLEAVARDLTRNEAHRKLTKRYLGLPKQGPIKAATHLACNPCLLFVARALDIHGALNAIDDPPQPQSVRLPVHYVAQPRNEPLNSTLPRYTGFDLQIRHAPKRA